MRCAKEREVKESVRIELVKALRQARFMALSQQICFGELKSDSLTELKSDNDTVHKCHVGLVPTLVSTEIPISSHQKRSEKVKNGRFLHFDART
jgi:hypothetical protein